MSTLSMSRGEVLQSVVPDSTTQSGLLLGGVRSGWLDVVAWVPDSQDAIYLLTRNATAAVHAAAAAVRDAYLNASYGMFRAWQEMQPQTPFTATIPPNTSWNSNLAWTSGSPVSLACNDDAPGACGTIRGLIITAIAVDSTRGLIYVGTSATSPSYPVVFSIDVLAPLSAMAGSARLIAGTIAQFSSQTDASTSSPGFATEQSLGTDITGLALDPTAALLVVTSVASVRVVDLTAVPRRSLGTLISGSLQGINSYYLYSSTPGADGSLADVSVTPRINPKPQTHLSLYCR